MSILAKMKPPKNMGRYRDLHVGSYGLGWIKSVFFEEKLRNFSRLKQGIRECVLKKNHQFFEREGWMIECVFLPEKATGSY